MTKTLEALTRQEAVAITGGTSISAGKGLFDYADHSKSIFTIEDVATSLSNICRYTGHILPGLFYSVAEHCVHVSRVVPEEMAFEGLMHDAPEAFIGDVNSVLKQFIGPEFKDLDHSVSMYLAHRYGYLYPYPREVKVADGRMYRTETPQITEDNDKFWLLDAVPYNIVLPCWNPTQAREEFLNRFKELYNVRYAVLQSEATTGAEAA